MAYSNLLAATMSRGELVKPAVDVPFLIRWTSFSLLGNKYGKMYSN